jgi:hypothetical protein
MMGREKRAGAIAVKIEICRGFSGWQPGYYNLFIIIIIRLSVLLI